MSRVKVKFVFERVVQFDALKVPGEPVRVLQAPFHHSSLFISVMLFASVTVLAIDIRSAGAAPGDILFIKQDEDYGTASAIALDSSGVYVAGTTQGSLERTNAGLQDAFVREYDIDGNVQCNTPANKVRKEAKAGSLGQAKLLRVAAVKLILYPMGIFIFFMISAAATAISVGFAMFIISLILRFGWRMRYSLAINPEYSTPLPSNKTMVFWTTITLYT